MNEKKLKFRGKMKFVVDLKEGEIILPKVAKKTLSQFEDAKMFMDLWKVGSQKSIYQLGWLWGFVYPPIAEYSGFSENEVHEFYCDKYLKPRIVTINGEEREIPNEFKRLNHEEVSEYIERVTAHANGFGVVIPPCDPSKSTRRLNV